MGEVSWTISALDVEIGTFSDSYVAHLEQLVLAAARDWGQYFQPDHDTMFEIELNIVDLPGAQLATGGTSFINTGVHNGEFHVAHPLTLFELSNGIDLNGTGPDIVVNLDMQALGNAHIETDLVNRSSTVPTQQYDLYSIILHELAHGFGILSFRDYDDSITGMFGTTFDAMITNEPDAPPVFVGAFVEQVNGGPLQLVSGNASHVDALQGPADAQFTNHVSLLAPTISPGQRLNISALELAILQDLGVRIETPTSGDDHIVGFNQMDIADVELLNDPELLPLNLRSILEGRDELLGQSGNDTLIGLGGDDNIFGEDGDDVLIGGSGADTLNGGAGMDVASYASAIARIHLDLRSSHGTSGDAHGDTFTSIENIIGSDFDDYVYGDDFENQINGGVGNDRLRGHNGNDTLIGGAGADDLNGGSGSDFATFSGSSAAITIDLTLGQGHGGDAQSDTFTSIENLIGSGFDDLLIGSRVSNEIRGGNGNDTLIGGQGRDVLDGGNGIDLATFSEASARVNLDLRASKGSAGEASGDRFHSIENIIGSQFDDYVYGDNSNNLILGGEGDDRLRGHNGNDTLIGGEGKDNLHGGSGVDLADYSEAQSFIRLDLRSLSGWAGDASGDRYWSIENITGSAYDDYVYGDSARNTIMGGGGDDLLRGHSGDDTLFGGAGSDDLHGGSGADTFVFNTALDSQNNVDTIRDFSPTHDRIILDSTIFTGLDEGRLSESAIAVGDTPSSQHNDVRIFYSESSGALFYIPNGSDPQAAIQFAVLTAQLEDAPLSLIVI